MDRQTNDCRVYDLFGRPLSLFLETKFPFFWIRLVKTISGEVRRISDQSIVEQPIRGCEGCHRAFISNAGYLRWLVSMEIGHGRTSVGNSGVSPVGHTVFELCHL